MGRSSIRALVVGVALLALAMPAAAGASSNGAAKQPLPKVTLTEAKKVLADTVKQDIAAAATNDTTVLPEFLAGINLEMGVAAFQEAAAAGEPAFEEYKSRTVKAFTLRSDSYPQRFIALVEDDLGGGSTDKSANLFVKESKKGPWLWERPLADPDKGWPQFALDKDGYVRTDVDAKKLLFDPATAPAELAAYQTVVNLDPPANAALFGSSFGTDDYREGTVESLGGLPEGYSATFTATPSAHEVLTFRLTGGSALVSFGLTSVTTLSHPDENPDEVVLSQSDDRKTIDARIEPGLYRELVFTDLEDFSVVVPTKKSKAAATASTILLGPISAVGAPVGDPSLYE